MLRKELRHSRMRRRVAPIAAILLVLPLAFSPQSASAGLFDLLFGNNSATPSPPAPVQQQQPNAYADPSLPPIAVSPVPAVSAGSGRFATYCVRTCDGRYFPLPARSGSPAQMCQAFCPASTTRIYSGNNIDYAVGSNGERYADSQNAFAYRKSLKSDCTCNGRDPGGLAPVDLSLDTTLRPGDIVATANGLVAYSGAKTATGQTAEFTPVANYPGLTADARAKLGEMKVAPVSAEVTQQDNITGSISTPVSTPIPASAIQQDEASQEDALRPLIEQQLAPLPTSTINGTGTVASETRFGSELSVTSSASAQS